MSYIIKRNNPLVNLKLTDTGRRNLSAGELNFSTFCLGDGEMDYTSDNTPLINVLRPTDNNHDILSPIPSNGTTFKQPITQITSYPYVVHTSAAKRGFFSGATASIIQPNLCSLYNISGKIAPNTTSVNLKYVETVTSPTYVDIIGGTGYTSSRIGTGYTTTVKRGDYLFLKFLQHDYYTGHTTNMTPKMDAFPSQYLMYNITSVNSGNSLDLSGITNNQIINFGLDRKLPNFPESCLVKGFIYPGRNTIPDYYDKETPIAYWSNGSLDFTSIPGETEIVDVPVWNMNIINIRDIIGLDFTKHKDKDLSVGKNYLGTAINYGYLSDVYTTINPNTIVTGVTANVEVTGYTQTINKIGVIHYTNNTIENFYGEGFYENTLKLRIPYLMWHKQQFGGTGLANSIGYTFIAGSTLKFINDTVAYYDLIDQETETTIVGKVLVDQKIIVLEDPELITALSYKANRNWTLPKANISLVDIGHCPGGNLGGSLQPNECIHITYQFTNTKGINGIQCENYQTIVNTFTKAKDILFQFPKKASDPTYSELSFLRDFNNEGGLGFSLDNVLLLWQKTQIGGVPDPTEWRKYNISPYIGTTGCVSPLPEVLDRFYLQTETNISPASAIISATKIPVGEVLVFRSTTSTSGTLLRAASSPATIGIDGNYYIYPLSVTGSTSGTPIIKLNPSYVGGTNIIQLAYLSGETNTSNTIKQVVTVPSIIPVTNTYVDGIYYDGSGNVCLTLEQQPNNNTVYVFYNGMLVSSSNYGVFTTGTTADRRVQLTFPPAGGALITLFYLDNSGAGLTPNVNLMTANNINNLKVYINLDLIDDSLTDFYNLGDIVNLPPPSATGFTFADEVFFYGNVETDIKATIYKTLFTFNVIPNTFISTNNSTFNVNQDKVAFTEVGIYDATDELVAIGKFSQPITRKYNSDILSLQATIDF